MRSGQARENGCSRTPQMTDDHARPLDAGLNAAMIDAYVAKGVPVNVDIRAEWAKRRWWMNLIFLFCLYMTFIYLPYDLILKPVADDEEVWFGFVLHGWWAKSTGLLHWLVYGAGAYGFWKMAHWMWPWAAVYTAQVAVSMLVWNLMDERGEGWQAGIAAAALFTVPTIALWRARSAFRAAGGTGSDDRAPQRPGDVRR